VLCSTTQPSLIAAIDAPLNKKNTNFEALLLAASSKANDLHGEISATVNSARHEQLMQRFRCWVSERKWRSQLKKSQQKKLQKKITLFSANSLQKACKKSGIVWNYAVNISKNIRKKQHQQLCTISVSR
jgi:hypothetical protein